MVTLLTRVCTSIAKTKAHLCYRIYKYLAIDCLIINLLTRPTVTRVNRHLRNLFDLFFALRLDMLEFIPQIID